MKRVLGLSLLSLVLASMTVPIDHVETTDISPSSTKLFTSLDAIPTITSTATNSFALNMVSASVVTDAQRAATGETSHRLPDATEDETEHDDRVESASREDGLFPASDNVAVPEGARSAGRQATDGDASSGSNAAPSASTATALSTADLGANTAAPAPSPVGRTPNWVSWLPWWYRHWAVHGARGVPRDTQLRVFSEALERHSERLQRSVNSGSTKVSQTQLVSVVAHQYELLQEFYQWIYQQLTTTEDLGDSSILTLNRFLDALKHNARLMESLCNWAPDSHLISNGGNFSAYREIFWALDKQTIWREIFATWAVGQYNLGVVPHSHSRWWLPTNLDEIARALNVSQNLQTRNDSVQAGPSGVQELGKGVCSAEDRPEQMDQDETFSCMSTETAVDRNSCSDQQRQLEKQDNPEGHEGLLPTCPLRTLKDMVLTKPLENERFMDEDSEHFEAVTIRPKNEIDPVTGEVHHVTPDKSFLVHHPLNMLQLEERTRESIIVEDLNGGPDQVALESAKSRRCSELIVLEVLGSFFEPHYLLYVRCNDREAACEPPEKCQPVLNVVSVVMPSWAQMPNFPHTVVTTTQLPDGRVLAKVLLPMSCTCIEPLV